MHNAPKTKGQASIVDPEQMVMTAVKSAIGQLRVAIDCLDTSCSDEIRSAKVLLDEFVLRAEGPKGRSVSPTAFSVPLRRLAQFKRPLNFSNGETVGLPNNPTSFKRPMSFEAESEPPTKKPKTEPPIDPAFDRLMREFDVLKGGYCETCEVRCPRKVQWEAHLRGKKHNSKTRWLATVGSDVSSGPTSIITSTGKEKFHCTRCMITCVGKVTWELHLSGKKHLKMLSPKSDGPTFNFSCDICNVSCTGEHQMELHLSGKKHLSAVSGKKVIKIKEEKTPKMFEIRTNGPTRSVSPEKTFRDV